jgi:leucyl aminopeptidase (aminopeptidase T)
MKANWMVLVTVGGVTTDVTVVAANEAEAIARGAAQLPAGEVFAFKRVCAPPAPREQLAA